MDNPIFVAALVLGAVALLFSLIGLATTYWITVPGGHSGLYVACNEVYSVCASIPDQGVTGRLEATRAFVSLGFICLIAGLIVALVYFCKFARNNVSNRTLPLVVGILYLVSGAFLLLACIIFVTGDSDGTADVSLGYSYVLTLLAAIAALVCGGLTLFHRTKLSPPA